MKRIMIAPSIICYDLPDIRNMFRLLEKYRVDYIHFDVLEEHPDFTLNIEQFREFKRMTNVPFDVHLMVKGQDKVIPGFYGSKDDFITFHYENSDNPKETIKLIRKQGSRPSIAINPETPADAVFHLLEKVEKICVMAVPPGLPGQRIVPGTFEKIRQIASYISRKKLEIIVEADGNTSFNNIKMMIDSGANFIVAGTSCLFYQNTALETALGKLMDYVSEPD